MNKNILKHIIRYILMLMIIIVCSTIFKFSSDGARASSKRSRAVSKGIIYTFLDGRNMSEEEMEEKVQVIEKGVRKLAHFSIYLLLGILLMLCCGTYKIENAVRFDISVMLAFLYASSDEFHQLFCAGAKLRN